MTRRLELSEKALDQAAGFLTDDPPGLLTVFDAIDRLVDDPLPTESFPFGSPDVRRLRVGRYRLLYEISDHEISIVRIARVKAIG